MGCLISNQHAHHLQFSLCQERVNDLRLHKLCFNKMLHGAGMTKSDKISKTSPIKVQTSVVSKLSKKKLVWEHIICVQF